MHIRAYLAQLSYVSPAKCSRLRCSICCSMLIFVLYAYRQTFELIALYRIPHFAKYCIAHYGVWYCACAVLVGMCDIERCDVLGGIVIIVFDIEQHWHEEVPVISICLVSSSAYRPRLRSSPMNRHTLPNIAQHGMRYWNAYGMRHWDIQWFPTFSSDTLKQHALSPPLMPGIIQ